MNTPTPTARARQALADAIRELHEAATPAPWGATTRQGGDWDWVLYQVEDDKIEICQMFHDMPGDIAETNSSLLVLLRNSVSTILALLAPPVGTGEALDKERREEIEIITRGDDDVPPPMECLEMFRDLLAEVDRQATAIVEAEAELEKANNEFGCQSAHWPDLWQRIAELKQLATTRWLDLQAAEACAASLAEENADLRNTILSLTTTLRIIAGEAQCLDNLMSNAEIAKAALKALPTHPLDNNLSGEKK